MKHEQAIHHYNACRTISLHAVLSHPAEGTNDVTFFPFDILNAGLESDQLNRRRVVGT